MNRHRHPFIPALPDLNPLTKMAIQAGAGTLLLSILATPAASADGTSSLAESLISVRSGSNCAPLNRNPIVDRVAQHANQATIDYRINRSPVQAMSDTTPVLSAFGYRAAKSLLLQGYAPSVDASIRGLLLQGATPIADCSYTDVGLAAESSEPDGPVYTVAILATTV